MKCLECGREFRPSGRGKPSKYCSGACKAKAYRRRKKNGEVVAVPKPTQAKENDPAGIPELDRRSFERMMDDSFEDVLRHNRDRLRAALDDISTPANALPAISRQLIAVSERLENMQGGGGLFDDDDVTEVSEDVGASIV
jgi:hypothetical protein